MLMFWRTCASSKPFLGPRCQPRCIYLIQTFSQPSSADLFADLILCQHQFDCQQSTWTPALRRHASPNSHILRMLVYNHHLARDQYVEKVILRRDPHFAFWTLDTRFLFAREPISFNTPPLRRPHIWAMSTVGTISWFLDPISTLDRHLIIMH